jgi:hypothetical protein
MKVPRKTTYRAPLKDRLAAYSQTKENGCIEWSGSRNWGGYGRIGIGKKILSAHRVAYEEFVGPIPTGMVLDHLCRNRACINPAHLEPVTQRENNLRGENDRVVLHRAKTCAKGHTLTQQPNGRMSCRQCNREAVRRYQQRRNAA